jgi:hypothetical protein
MLLSKDIGERVSGMSKKAKRSAAVIEQNKLAPVV